MSYFVITKTTKKAFDTETFLDIEVTEFEKETDAHETLKRVYEKVVLEDKSKTLVCYATTGGPAQLPIRLDYEFRHGTSRCWTQKVSMRIAKEL